MGLGHLDLARPMHTLSGGVGNVTEADGSQREEVAIGPVLWRGTSPTLTALGKTAVFGGGKTAIDCQTGLFDRVLLGPLKYEP